MDHKFRMNRAVGILHKGDQFTSDPDDPKIMALLGAGYMDDLGEVHDDIQRAPTEHAADSSGDGAAVRADDVQRDRGGSEEDGAV